MPNSKILVNWTTQKVIRTIAAIDSSEYQSLLEKGYVKIGIIKATGVINKITEDHITVGIFVFIDKEYFEPKDKYKKFQKPLD